MTEMFRVLSPGGYTTVQDAGRFGWQQFGVPPCGMLDGFAGSVANMLVGNPASAALLELTFSGASFEILAPADIALAGADMPVTVNGVPMPGWCAVRVDPGDRLDIGPARSGCRGYLAVSRGIDVPLVMGSRSCYVGAAMGGFKGRPLKAGDILHRGAGKVDHRICRVPQEWIPAYRSEITLRAVPGPQDDCFDRGLDTFFSVPFTVSPQANRMGYRLQGPAIHHAEGKPKSIISEPSMPGGVQIPQDGQPIVLLVEQTVGGYTKIATVISADIPRIAQALPGDTVRFVRVGLDEAHAACRDQQALLEKIRERMHEYGTEQKNRDPGAEGPAVDWGSEAVLNRLIHHLRQV